MTVRLAREDDRQEIWRLLLQAHKENALFPISVRKVDWWVSRALNHDTIDPADTGPRAAIGVIGPSDNLEALVFVTFGSLWYTEQRHLEELLSYVDPDHRKSTHARELANWMKMQTESLHIPLVTGIVSTERTEAKCRLYGRTFPKAGEFFLYRPNGLAVEGE